MINGVRFDKALLPEVKAEFEEYED
jgi:hypothetical protein